MEDKKTDLMVGSQNIFDYAIFQDHGYKGLYGGLGAKDIHAKKKLKKSQKILDHMGSTELAANLFLQGKPPALLGDSQSLTFAGK